MSFFLFTLISCFANGGVPNEQPVMFDHRVKFIRRGHRCRCLSFLGRNQSLGIRRLRILRKIASTKSVTTFQPFGHFN